MTLSFSEEREKVVLPSGAKEDMGVRPPDNPVVTELVEASFESRSVNDQLRQLRDSVRPEQNLLSLAKILGLTYFIGDVATAADTKFDHDLNRLPVVIVFSIDLDGLGGVVLGVPGGMAGANVTPWSQTSIYVRATRAARYAFFVM